MSRLAGFSLALLLSLVAGQARAQDSAPEAADTRDGRVLWIEPLGTVLGLALSNDPLTVISGGYAHPLDARRALALELLVAHEQTGCRSPVDACFGSTLVRASVGMAYSYGGSPGRGLLFQPRLILGYYPSGVSLQAGLDVGYQWRAGPVYLALVGGLAAGVSTVAVDLPPFVSTDPPFNRDSGRGLRPMLGLNLHLLRLGFTF